MWAVILTGSGRCEYHECSEYFPAKFSGHRSVHRDLEAQFLIITYDEKLKTRLQEVGCVDWSRRGWKHYYLLSIGNFDKSAF